MIISQEPLSWELLDYWRSKGEEPSFVREVPLLVARKESKIVGFAALSTTPSKYTAAVLAPLLADNIWVNFKLSKALHDILRGVGITRLSFWVNEDRQPKFLTVVKKSGLCEEKDVVSGDHWFVRDFGTK